MNAINKLNSLIQTTLPAVYDDSLSFYDLIGKITAKLDEVIDSTNEFIGMDLQAYVGDILTAWKDDGTLDQILDQYAFNKMYWKSLLEFPRLAVETNDSPRLQRAIDSVRATQGTVFVPQGVYYVSGVELPSGISLIGEGIEKTVFKVPDNVNEDCFISDGFATLTGTNSNGGVVGLRLSHFTIDGNKDDNTSGCGLKIYGYRTIMEHIKIKNCKQDGFVVEWGTTAGLGVDGDLMESHYYDLRVHDNDGNGIVCRGSHDSIFTDVLTYLNGLDGFVVDSSDNYSGAGASLNGFHSYTNGRNGIVLKGLAIGSNIQSESNTGDGIQILSADVMLHGVLTYLNQGSGIVIGSDTLGISGTVLSGKSMSNTGKQIDIKKDFGNNIIDLLVYVDSGQIPMAGQPSKDSKVQLVIGGANTSNISHVNYTPSARGKATTPPLPTGTGSANSVQNTNHYPVMVYMFNFTGVVLVQTDGTDYWLGQNDSVILAPQEKIYFFTKTPDEWHWYGL